MGFCGSIILNVLFTSICLDNFFISGNSYVNYSLNEDKVCSRLFLKTGIKRLSVGKDEKSAIIVHSGESLLTNFVGLKGKPLECSFIVEATFSQGIFAVIQKMKLRKNVTKNECIDYVQFCKPDPSFIERKVDVLFSSKCQNNHAQYCGEVILPSKFEEEEKTYPLNPSAFQEPTGIILVKIYVAPTPLLPGETRDLEIAFTAYKSCSSDISSYKMCSGNSRDGVSSPDVGDGGTCIYKYLFNDGVVNCPYAGCADECDPKKDEPFHMSMKVTMTAVSSIFVSFFLFLGCIWACRYFEILCWGVQNLRTSSGSTSRRRGSHVNVDDIFTPSAPSLPEHSPDKDLPPSYETLFPDR